MRKDVDSHIAAIRSHLLEVMKLTNNGKLRLLNYLVQMAAHEAAERRSESQGRLTKRPSARDPSRAKRKA